MTNTVSPHPPEPHRPVEPKDPAVGGIDWLVFDLGGVVLRHTKALPELARRMGARAEDFVTAYYAHRLDYDRGADVAGYWRAVAGQCGAPAPDAAQVADLVRCDDRGWSTVDESMVALLQEMRPVTRLAALSNAPTSMGTLVRGSEWAAAFELILVSGDLGLVKPGRAVYEHLLDTLGAEPERVVFVDDRADNVAGAAGCGIRAMRFSGVGPLRAALIQMGVLAG